MYMTMPLPPSACCQEGEAELLLPGHSNSSDWTGDDDRLAGCNQHLSSTTIKRHCAHRIGVP